LHPGEQPPVEAGVPGADGAVAGVVVQIHAGSIMRLPPNVRRFSDSKGRGLADFGLLDRHEAPGSALPVFRGNPKQEPVLVGIHPLLSMLSESSAAKSWLIRP